MLRSIRAIPAGRYIRPSNGILGDEATNAVPQQRTGIEGVFVLGVEPASPAARAGIMPARREAGRIVPWDVIIALDGKPVSRLVDLAALLDDRAVGETVALTVQRGSDQREVRLALHPGR